MSEELKPCPFCGAKPDTYKSIVGINLLGCPNSACRMNNYGGFLENEWQPRPIEDALRAKLDVAREALEKIPHMGFPDEREYHPWYPNCAGCIAEEALQKIKE